MPNKSDINIDLLNNYENENSSSSLTLVSYKNKAQRDGRHDYFPKNEDHIIFPVTASSCPRWWETNALQCTQDAASRHMRMDRKSRPAAEDYQITHREGLRSS